MPTGCSSPARIEKRLAAKARARASKAKEELDITVSLLDGEPTTMKLLAGDKVGAVAMRFQEFLQANVYVEQILFDSTVLDKEALLMDCGIVSGSHLVLKLEEFCCEDSDEEMPVLASSSSDAVGYPPLVSSSSDSE